jgi:hypothetical protein
MSRLGTVSFFRIYRIIRARTSASIWPTSINLNEAAQAQIALIEVARNLCANQVRTLANFQTIPNITSRIDFSPDLMVASTPSENWGELMGWMPPPAGTYGA